MLKITAAHVNKRPSTVLKVDKNYSYAMFISYCEVYNEKVRLSRARFIESFGPS